MRLLPLTSAIVFASGFCTLAYQVVWMRMLRLLFGASTPATATVLAVFMGGLGLGGLWIGARADRAQRPLRLYAMVEAGVAGSAALTPLLIAGAGAAYPALGGSTVLGSVGGVLVRIVLATVAIGAPAVLMGGTLPAIARASLAHADRRRAGLGLLYGANTLGACVGAAAATFVLIEQLGVRGTLFAACALNALLALAAYGLSARGEDDAEPKPAPEPERPEVALSPRTLWALAFASGLLFFTAELVWYRLGTPILGGSTYTFGLILACVLLGIGGGGALYAVAPPKKPSVAHLGITFSALGVALATPLALGDRLAVLAYHLRPLGHWSFPALSAGWAIVAGVLVLPTAIIAGYQLPLLLGVRGRGPAEVGQHTGEIYAANTVGAIAGSLLGGFVALPALGAVETWRALAVALAVIGLALGLHRPRSTRRLAAAAGLAALAALLVVAEGPSALFRHGSIGFGRRSSPADRDLYELKRGVEATIIEEHDGRETAVGLHAGNGLSLLNNGRNDGNLVLDRQTTVGLAAIPALLHPGPKKAFVVGLASGQTAGFLGRIDGVERVTVAEIEPAVRAFAAQGADCNFGMLDNPRVEVVFTDAREALATSGERYDLVVSEPSHPYRAGIASLYSLEFYRAVDDHLARGGLFTLWLQGYESSPVILTRVLTTLREVFAHTAVWETTPSDLAIVSSQEPIVIDGEQVRARIARPPFDVARRVLDVWDAESLIARHLAGDELIGALTQKARLPPETDDHPRLEFDFVNTIGVPGSAGADFSRLARSRAQHLPLVTSRFDPTRAETLAGRRYLLRGEAPPPTVPSEVPLAALMSALNGSDARLIREVLGRLEPPAPDDDYALLLATLGYIAVSDGSDLADILARLAELERRGLTGDVAWLRVLVALRQRSPDVVQRTEQACATARSDPWSKQWIVHFALRALQADLRGAPENLRVAAARALLEDRFSAYMADFNRITAAQALLSTGSGGGPPPAACVDAFAPYPHHTPWSRETLAAKHRCFATHAPELAPAAARELATFEQRVPATYSRLLQGD